METANLKNELASLQKTIADGAVQFDVKGIKTKIAARQLIGAYLLIIFCTCSYMCGILMLNGDCILYTVCLAVATWPGFFSCFLT